MKLSGEGLCGLWLVGVLALSIQAARAQKLIATDIVEFYCVIQVGFFVVR